MTSHRKTILIADGWPAVRESLSALLSTDPAFTIVGTAGSGLAAEQEAHQKRPDIILIDPNFGRIREWEVISRIKLAIPEAVILVHSNEISADQLLQAIQRGASDLIHKALPPHQLINRVKMADARQFFVNPAVARLLVRHLEDPPGLPQTTRPLSETEFAVLRLVADNQTVSEIAGQLGVSLHAVFSTISSTIEKVQFAYFSDAALVKGY